MIKMMKPILLFTLTLPMLLSPITSPAQQQDSIYTLDYLDKSTRFAWTTFGMDLLALNGGTSEYLDPMGNRQTTSWSGSAAPRLTIGGIHFYGHADFYVTFPLNFLSFGQSTPDAFRQMIHESGIETGIRLYPVPIKPGALRPYAGISFRSLSFGFEPQNSGFTKAFPLYERFVYPLQAGLTYATSRHLISVGVHYQTTRSIRYALSETEMGTVEFEPLSFQFGILKYIDTDRGARSRNGAAAFNARHALLRERKALSGVYVGIGPSSFLQTRTSPLVANQYPHLSGDNLNAFTVDLTAGYYFHRPDMNIGLAYRGIGSRMKAIDDEIEVRRRSLMLEAYKFLFNYRGFVPFLGVTGSMEFLKAELNGNSRTETKPALGIVFGWDIRVVNTETWLLRTNLRYVPGLEMELNGDQVALDHLEFNFIQFVYFPGRKKAYKSARIE